MNPFDVVIIVIICFGLIRGIFRGLVKELSSIIGVFAGFYGAFTYYESLTKPLSRWITDIAYLNITSFMILFCAIFLLISMLGVVIKYLLNISFLGWLDRICGALFGSAKGILIATVLMFTLTAFLPSGSPVIKNSSLAPHISIIAENMAKVVPKDTKQEFFKKIEGLKKSWKIHP